MGVVYAIRCEVSGKEYVGSTTVALRRRIGRHEMELTRGTHCSKALQAAWDKHGAAAFTVRTLERVDDANFLRAREQAWIWRLKPRYNSVMIVTCVRPIVWSDEQRAAISARVSGERHPQYGVKQSGKRLTASRAILLAYRTSGAPHPMLGHKASDELRATRSKNAKRLWADPQYRVKAIAARVGKAYNKGYKCTPEQVENRRRSGFITAAKRRLVRDLRKD